MFTIDGPQMAKFVRTGGSGEIADNFHNLLK